MNNYSNKELKALATRAARGAYMPWGLAEEAAASVAWLERHGIAGVGAFVDLLTANDGQDPANQAPVFGRDDNGSRKDARVCPILTGAYLSDLRGDNLSENSLEIQFVFSPVLLVPFLVWVARDLGRSLWVQWGRVLVHVCGDGVEIVSGAEELELPMRQDVAISLAPGRPELTGVILARTDVSNRHRLILERFVQRTLLPESEASKTSGAGGDRIDDD